MPLPVLSHAEQTAIMNVVVRELLFECNFEGRQDIFDARVDIRFALDCLHERQNRLWAAQNGRARAEEILLFAECGVEMSDANLI